MEKVLGTLGRSFLLAGIAPVCAFAVLHLAAVLLFHALRPAVPLTNPVAGLSADALLANGALLALVAATGLAGILVALNGTIIHWYEGQLPILRPLLDRWQRQNLARHDAWYREILGLRDMRARARADVSDGAPADQDRRLASTALGLHDAYARVELAHPTRALPLRPELVKPTALGNAYAVLEEYPFERYGIDSMVFWSRLIALIPADYRGSIGDQKATCDLLLHTSLLCAVFGVESLVFLLVEIAHAWLPAEALALALVSLAVSYGLYRVAVSETAVLGKLIDGAFDLYRHALLRQFEIDPPATLEEERQIWRRLATFIRRGEDFYYPGRGAATTGGSFARAPASSATTGVNEAGGRDD